MTQNNTEFVTIALPKEVVDKIDKVIKESDLLYQSRPHVVKLALSKFFNNGGGKDESEKKTC